MKPNILFITTDMQRFDTLGCMNNPLIKTPHIDRLAETGVKFTQAFVNNPVCMPSRASLFTGKLPSVHGVRWNNNGLAEHEETVTKVLQRAGYQTAAIGKMHWGDSRCDFGLDYLNVTHGGDGNVLPHELISAEATSYRQALERAGLADVPQVQSHPDYKMYYGAVASPLPADYHLDGFIGNATVEFLEKRDHSKPFFCWASFNGPHLPIDPSPPWDTLYDPGKMPLPVWTEEEFDSKPPEQRAFQRNTNRGNGFGDNRAITYDLSKLRRFIAHYWGKISMIDHYVGKIVAALEKSGDLDNTIVIFTSDHGDFVGSHRLLFKSAFLYDDLLRVPLVVSWPKQWQAAVVDNFVEGIDLPVTMLKLAGLEPAKGMQGLDFTPLLEGSSERLRDVVYAEAVDKRMIRTEHWKLVHYGDKPYGELYNLEDDPNELMNLYDKEVSLPIREELQCRLLDRILKDEAKLHDPVNYLELDDPTYPGDPGRRVAIPFI